MDSNPQYNKKSSAVKRILSEARELQRDTSTEYSAAPLENNIFEWHWTLRGAPGTEFEEGIYHGRVILPSEYPFRPPSLLVLTPNGRWEVNKKICLTFTGFHEEQWQPAWGIRTALLGVQAFMAARREAAQGIGSLEVGEDERRRLASISRAWTCPTCNLSNEAILPNPAEGTERTAEQLPEGLSIDAEAAARKEESIARAEKEKEKLEGSSGAAASKGEDQAGQVVDVSSSDAQGDVAAPQAAAPVAPASPQAQAAPQVQAQAPAAAPAQPAARPPLAAAAAVVGAGAGAGAARPVEQRVAQLDRAIITVLLLLAALLVRRIL